MGVAKVRREFKNAVPGSLDNLPRSFSSFDLPAGFERVSYRLDIIGRPNGVVELSSKADGPSKPKRDGRTTTGHVIRLANGATIEVDDGPSSSAALWLCGDLSVGAMFKEFFAGRCSLGWIADWIEDDIGDRVKGVRHHWLELHRLHEDPVQHFLTLMRRYRDRRKVKPTTYTTEGDK